MFYCLRKKIPRVLQESQEIDITSINIIHQVCELDIIFNFEKAYFMLDELMLGGEIQETSKKNVLKAIQAQDLLQEVRVIFSYYI